MAQQQRRPFRPVRQEEPYRINERIRVPQVRMVGENVPQGIFDIQQALKMAEEQNLDLVEISPNAVP
ncbi:MAG TPA: translation initiation factor IF-3, partial [Runella sp.]|nr:translation initiation factor IF-3 [Runella sp.]